MNGLERRRVAGGVVILSLSAMLLMTPPAEAQDVSIVLPLPTVIEGEQGSQHLVASQDVPEEVVGTSCSARAEAENQSSVHPGNDLVIASNGSELVLEDVEREPEAVTVSQGSLVVGDQVTVTLVMGRDGIFSAGMTVELGCEPTTTTSSSTTTTIPETTTTEGDTTTTTERDTTTTTERHTTTTTETTVVDETTTTTSETTTTISATTTEADTTTTVLPSSTDSTLPFTGTGAHILGGAALAALLVGAGLTFLARRTGGGEPVYSETYVEGVRVRLLRPGD